MQHTPGCSEGLPSPSPPRLIPTHHQHFFGQPRSPCGTPGLVRNDATAAGCDAKRELTRPEGPASSCVLPKSHAEWVAPPARLIAAPLYKAQQPLVTSHSSPWFQAEAPRHVAACCRPAPFRVLRMTYCVQLQYLSDPQGTTVSNAENQTKALR